MRILLIVWYIHLKLNEYYIAFVYFHTLPLQFFVLKYAHIPRIILLNIFMRHNKQIYSTIYSSIGTIHLATCLGYIKCIYNTRKDTRHLI